jgi:hypothetical protein
VAANRVEHRGRGDESSARRHPEAAGGMILTFGISAMRIGS